MAFLYGVVGIAGGAEPGPRAAVDPGAPGARTTDGRADRAPTARSQLVPASELRRGDRVLVRAGDTIPVDGAVAAGRSSVDQKTITGESVPVVREEGDPVLRGDGQRRRDAARSRRPDRWATP